MRASEPLSVVFFKTDSGSEPVRNWLREDLTSAQRTIIGKNLKIVQFMWPIGMPLVRPLGDGLWGKRKLYVQRSTFNVKKQNKSRNVLIQDASLTLARKRKAAFRKG